MADKLEFQNVEFAYSNGKEALRGISLSLPKGSTTALVGASGSGKSTVAALLLRLREPTKGSILVDGEDFWQFSPTSWHRAVGVVEQDSFLFHDTIAMNITFGLEGVSEADIWEALEAAQLREFVEELPKKLQTVVGERGTMLSGGQKQRLAIARALVRKPSMLILDEATSALDNTSENLVQVALEKAMKNRTVLIIAHRLSTIRHADQILVLDKGKLAERGSWNELVQSNGLFSEFLKSIQMIPQTP